MADFTQGISGALNTLQQQAFNNQQVATRNDLLNQSTQMDLQQKQLALENEQNTQRLWNKLQNSGAPDVQGDLSNQVKSLTENTKQDTHQVDMLREMAKLAPTPEKSIMYAKAADDAEKKSADTQKAQLDTVAKTLNIAAGLANGAVQGDSQQSWDYYKAQAMANGVPLPKGVTGDWAHDKPLVEAASHQVDKQKDIVSAKLEQLRIDQAEARQKETQDYHTKSLAISRSNEALKRERLDFDKNKPTSGKDPKVPMQKELNTIHNQYMGQYQRLIKERDKASTKDGKEVVNERIATLNQIYGQQKRDVANSFGAPVGGSVSTASDFMAKYGLQ